MFLPFALVPYVIGQTLTPRAAVQVLVPVIAALNLELPQLTHFLLAVCTKTEDNHPPVTIQDKTEVGLIHNRQRMSKDDNSCWSNILHKQLPSLQPGGSDLGNSVAAMQNIAVSTKQFRVSFDRNTHQQHLDAEAKKKPATVGERDSHQVDRILKAFNVEMEEDLPTIRPQMANCKRGGQPLFALFQTKVSVEATHLGKPAMRVTVGHKQALKSFTFNGDGNPSKIDSWLLPFIVIPPGATSDSATARQVEIDATMLDYGVLFEGARGLSLADSHEIRKVKAYLPDDWDEGTAQLYAFLSSLLPPTVATIPSLSNFLLHSSCLTTIDPLLSRGSQSCGGAGLVSSSLSITFIRSCIDGTVGSGTLPPQVPRRHPPFVMILISGLMIPSWLTGSQIHVVSLPSAYSIKPMMRITVVLVHQHGPTYSSKPSFSTYSNTTGGASECE
mmetsp:Transcript_31582/g.35346  ORF Transcript_31582/g.35346 Transcript_31582/m.35346 type:complete len:444 (+) Transcript_31582:725-2056(+)